MYPRILDIANLSKKKSLFLFGPRSTGKTTLLNQQFPKERIINLLKSSLYLPLAQAPERLEEMIYAMPFKDLPVIIDEIQKLPPLLDEIHYLIESKHIHFILTGSSARKLKSTGVNLLAGRAWQCNLFPLCSAELGTIDLDRYLLYGGLPQVLTSEDPLEELDAYINTYLKEEIMAEALVQNLIHFSSFLKTAAISNAQQINYSNISRDTGIPVSSVRAWFEILKDSFLGFLLEPWQSPKRKAVATAKFYFFDVGVANFLAGFHYLPRAGTEYGRAFEHFIAMELRAYLSYSRIKTPLYYWRSRDGLEVDFIIGNDLAVEVKASHSIQKKDLHGLRALAEEGDFKKRVLVCMEDQARLTEDGILIENWRDFLKDLWSSLGAKSALT
ncbi:MAG TPA: ATP-binding protein [Treponema sp.]|nr:ATP-binding protein [Treponema sp.]HPC72755.1 ATP-binding protein [Treponema sp.]HRS04415.1 ATP-binding protein [Treponema sp.]HRU28896.1 ATP-binding protein [Treponema sp.]